MISVYWIDSSKRILISSSTQPIYQLFSQSTITLQVVLTVLEVLLWLFIESSRDVLFNSRDREEIYSKPRYSYDR